MIGLVDLGLGNLRAFSNILTHHGTPHRTVSTPECLGGISGLVLPGVGAFDRAMEALQSSGLRDSLDEAVLRRGVPVLGVCVGMQIMARRSDEGKLDGLGWIAGEVRHMSRRAERHGLRLPHMGWNDVQASGDDAVLFQGLSDPRFYFLHSYEFVPDSDCVVSAICDYSGPVVAAIASNRVFGVQFHPEKSHHWGSELLRNFCELHSKP
jgi:glutamine amidotransferase